MYYIRKRIGNKRIVIMMVILTLALGTGGVAIQVLADDRKPLEPMTGLEPEPRTEIHEIKTEVVPEITTEPVRIIDP